MDEIILEDEETGLLVSNLGRVWGPKKELKMVPFKDGYFRVTYRRKGEGKQRQGLVFVHRLVARNFLPNPLNLPIINHKDENPKNNRVDNLEWCSYKYNMNYGKCLEKRLPTRIKNGKARSITLERNGVILHFDSVSLAAKELNLGYAAVRSVALGKLNSTGGWSLPGNKPKWRTGEITLIKGNEKATFRTVAEASKQLGILESNLYAVRNGKNSQAKGWHLPGTTPIRNYNSGPITITNGIDTATFPSKAIAERKLGICKGYLNMVQRGKANSAHGWRFVDENQ